MQVRHEARSAAFDVTIQRIGPRFSRFVLATVSLILIVLSAGPIAAASLPPCPVEPARDSDGWLNVPGPTFSAGSPTITAFASSIDARLWLVTNGTEIHVSRDEGCNWVLSHSTPTTQVMDSSVTALGIGEDGLALAGFSGPAERALPGILVTQDYGRSWTNGSTGLPPTGSPRQIVLDPNDRSVAYLLLEMDAGALLYVSDDGGGSWTLATGGQALLGGIAGASLNRVAIDPQVSDSLWGTSDQGLTRSMDGGTTWNAVDQVQGPLEALYVSRTGGGPAVIWAFGSNIPTGFVSSDGGETWQQIDPPGVVDSIASPSAGDPSDVTVSTANAVYRFITGSGWVPLRTAPPAVSELQTIFNGDVLGRSSNTIARYDGRGAYRSPIPPLPFEEEDCDDLPLGLEDLLEGPEDSKPIPPARLGSRRSKLTPQDVELELAPGEVRSVPYRLEIWPTPTPVDVYFLIDTTGSMGNAICQVRTGLADIVKGLAYGGYDAMFGVGQYKDYEYGEDQIDDFAYRRDRAVGPADRSLVDALEQLTAEGGGSTGPESATSALFQAATGSGQDVAPAGPSNKDIAPNQQAGFRPEALKTIINVTDISFRQGSIYPTFPETISALQREGIFQLGIPVSGNTGARGDLARVARGTGAVATRPVDCDGDGDDDIRVGDALVCDAPAGDYGSMADVVVTLVNSIRDLRTVSLEVRDRSSVVQRVGAPYPNVDLKNHSALDFPVAFSCPPVTHKRTFRVGIEGVADSLYLANSVARVTCRPGSLGVSQEAPPPALVQFPPAPPEPPPNPQTRPGNQPQTNPQPNQQAQGQAAVVPQRQEQPQMAFVHAALAQQETASDLLMSASRTTTSSRGDRLAATRLGLLAGALAMGLSYGWIKQLARSSSEAAARRR